MRKEERQTRNRWIKNKIIEFDVQMQKHPKLRNMSFPFSCILETDILLMNILLRKYKGKAEIKGYGMNPYYMVTLKNPHCKLKPYGEMQNW